MTARILLFMLVARGEAQTIDTATVGATLAFPVEASSSTSTVDVALSMAEYDYTGPGVTQRTRAYNGGMAGPTIRLKPGDTLNVVLTNNLPPEAFDTSVVHNEFRDFDRTNLHTHGLHVSSLAPADDVFIDVGPGESYTYKYSIPSDHMCVHALCRASNLLPILALLAAPTHSPRSGARSLYITPHIYLVCSVHGAPHRSSCAPPHRGGTFWYHAHHHGSTNIQAGGGAVGAIIVEDPAGSLPPAVAALEETLLLLRALLYYIGLPNERGLAVSRDRIPQLVLSLCVSAPSQH